MSEIARLRQSAKGMFQKLAARAEIDPSSYTCAAEWLKDDARRLHIVQRYDHSVHPPLILKYAMKPTDADGFGKILDAHHEAQLALKDNETATVPQILSEDRESQAYLMTFFEGETFLNLCRDSDNHVPHLKAVGAWLSAYHSNTFQQERAFQPKFMVRHMAHLVDQMERGERKIKGQRRFVHLARGLAEYSTEADGHVGKIAAKHGDLNAHNLLIENEKVAAFDFLAQSHAPVAYDIARILLSYIQMAGDVGTIPKGRIIPPEAKDAFFEGYKFVEQKDPTIDFLLRTQILTDWNRMQGKTNINTIFRFERLKAIARRAFA